MIKVNSKLIDALSNILALAVEQTIEMDSFFEPGEFDPVLLLAKRDIELVSNLIVDIIKDKDKNTKHATITIVSKK